jgi:hypothetical protein
MRVERIVPQGSTLLTVPQLGLILRWVGFRLWCACEHKLWEFQWGRTDLASTSLLRPLETRRISFITSYFIQHLNQNGYYISHLFWYSKTLHFLTYCTLVYIPVAGHRPRNGQVQPSNSEYLYYWAITTVRSISAILRRRISNTFRISERIFIFNYLKCQRASSVNLFTWNPNWLLS